MDGFSCLFLLVTCLCFNLVLVMINSGDFTLGYYCRIICVSTDRIYFIWFNCFELTHGMELLLIFISALEAGFAVISEQLARGHTIWYDGGLPEH